MYFALKHLHIALVVVSLSGFVLRFALAAAGSRWVRHKAAAIVPHVVDTLLLAAAIGMLVVARMDPLQHPWLLAKIGGLLAYIVFGTLALKRAKTRAGRNTAFVAALMAFAYVVSAALSKSAWGFLFSS